MTVMSRTTEILEQASMPARVPRRLSPTGEILTCEPERIRGSYAVKATRVEPVGVVYLWPVSG